MLRDNVWSAEMAGVLQFMLIIYRFRWVSVRCNTPFQWFRPMVIPWPPSLENVKGRTSPLATKRLYLFICGQTDKVKNKLNTDRAIGGAGKKEPKKTRNTSSKWQRFTWQANRFSYMVPQVAQWAEFCIQWYHVDYSSGRGHSTLTLFEVLNLSRNTLWRSGESEKCFLRRFDTFFKVYLSFIPQMP